MTHQLTGALFDALKEGILMSPSDLPSIFFTLSLTNNVISYIVAFFGLTGGEPSNANYVANYDVLVGDVPLAVGDGVVSGVVPLSAAIIIRNLDHTHTPDRFSFWRHFAMGGKFFDFFRQERAFRLVLISCDYARQK